MAMSINGPLTVDGVTFPFSAVGNTRGLLPGGKAFYVCNRTGVTNGTGKSAKSPFASILYAVAAIANRGGFGDCIYVLPGHAESVNAADWLSAQGTASNYSIVGIGTGSTRGTLTWTTATSTLLLDTDGMEIANLNLYFAGPDVNGTALTVATPITVTGAGCRIVNCYIRWGFDADQIVGTGVLVSPTGDDFVFADNICIANVAAVPTTTFMTLNGADRCQIIGNYISGPTSGTTVGVIRGLTTASLNMLVFYNTLANILASSTIAISPLAASTGIISQNQFAVNSGILGITAGIGDWFDNLTNNTQGKTGASTGTAST